jgi:hypothetical protein
MGRFVSLRMRVVEGLAVFQAVAWMIPVASQRLDDFRTDALVVEVAVHPLL